MDRFLKNFLTQTDNSIWFYKEDKAKVAELLLKIYDITKFGNIKSTLSFIKNIDNTSRHYLCYIKEVNVILVETLLNSSNRFMYSLLKSFVSNLFLLYPDSFSELKFLF